MPKVLMVEDDPFLVDIYVKKFVGAGFQIKQFTNYNKIIDKVVKEKPDIISCGIVVPGRIDGFKAVKMLKDNKRTRDIPIIILTNIGQKEEIEKGLRLGAVDYLVKANFSPHAIVQKFKDHLKETGHFTNYDFKQQKAKQVSKNARFSLGWNQDFRLSDDYKRKIKGGDLFSYIWAVIVNIFTVIVVLAIFSKAFSDFETIIFSLSIFIFLAINNFFAVYAQNNGRQLFTLSNELREIKDLFHKSTIKNKKDDELDKMDKIQQVLRKASIKFWINTVFNFIIFVIVLFNLIGAL